MKNSTYVDKMLNDLKAMDKFSIAFIFIFCKKFHKET